MEFCLNHTIDVLSRTPKVLRELLFQLPSSWLNSNEGGDSWSPYDIVGHLIHGEKTDWILRTEIILAENVDKQFKPFDREAQFEDSKGKTLENLLDEFEVLRKLNLQKLKDLNISKEDLQRTGVHPHFGEVTLEQLLSTWLVHDLGHIAQIARVMAKQYKASIGPWEEYLPIVNA